jgi:tetratricopeptide (TPR) repeat protein
MKKERGESSRKQGKQLGSSQPADSTVAQVAALLEKARVHHGAERLAEAELAYREILQISPDQPDALHLLGVIAHQVGQNALGLELVDSAIRARAAFAEAYFSRGNILYGMKRYQDAVESYDKTLAIHPLYAEAHNNRGGALQAMKRFEEALECYAKALALMPDYGEARSNRSNALRELALQTAAQAPPVKTASSGRDLVFYCGPTVEAWTPQTAKEKGIGGSEEAIIWLSRLLHERGWNVTVYCNCGSEESDYDGVKWKPYWMWNQRDRQDVTVIWRQPVFADAEINSEKVILDLHDTIGEGDLTEERVQRFYKILVKSKFHRSLYPSVADEKFAIIPNGIDTTLFHGEEERVPRLLINTSSPDRSLEAFLDCFEEIKKQVPDVKAQWAYGWEMFDASYIQRAKRAEWQAKIVKRIQELGVEDLGRINHSEIAKLYQRANIFAYPTEFAEIDCISLSKAMAAGAIPITTDFAAMGDKAGHGGVFLHSKTTKDTWCGPGQIHFEMTDPDLKAQFVREAVKLLLNPPTEKEREPMREWARGAFDWNAVAEAWHEVLEAPLPSPAKPVPATVDELLQEARGHHIAGRLSEAQLRYREVLQVSPNHPDALHLLGVIASQIGHYALGIELIETAIEVKPDFAEAYFSRGNAQYALQQFTAALESYDKAIELKPLFADARFSRGNALHALGEYSAAMESYDRAIKLNPGYPEAYNNRGGSRLALKQYEAALEDYSQAILLKPDYAEAHCNRGNALYALGPYEAALESFDKAMLLQPDNADVHSNRGNALQALRQYLAALDSYDKAIELNPLNADAHNNRGSVLHALEQYAAALKDYERAIELKPDHADARRNRENSQRAVEQYTYFRPDYDVEKERRLFETARREVARIAKIQDKAQMKAELEALPRDLRFHPAVISMRNLHFVKTESSGRDLVFYCSPPNETWNPETARSKGVGGSEEAVIWLSKLLHERGWNVTVYGSCGLEEKEYDGVVWRPYWMWNCRDKQDVTVLWRYAGYAEYEINSDAVVVDMHDFVWEEAFAAKQLERIDKIFVKSRFHRSLYPNIPDEKFVVLANGIDAKLFESDGERDPMLLINTSSADRSMEAFLDCFEEIKKQVPEAKAQWAYGWGVWDYKTPRLPSRWNGRQGSCSACRRWGLRTWGG